MDGRIVCSEAPSRRHQLAARRLANITSEFQNARDPYGKAGQMLKTLMPVKAGNILPKFPTIDEVIAAYTRQARRA